MSPKIKTFSNGTKYWAWLLGICLVPFLSFAEPPTSANSTSITADISAQITLPKQLMCFAFNENIQNWQINLYPEALLNNADLDLSLNNALFSVVNKYSKITGKTSKRTLPLCISCEGYANKAVNIPVIDVNVLNGKNADIRFMALGSSNVQNGYAIHVKKFANRLNVDLGNVDVKMIGTRNSESSVTDNYKGKVYEFPGDQLFCEGYAGHAQANLLRHFMQLRLNDTSKSWLLCGKEAWDSLGLGTKTKNGHVGQSYVAWNPSNKDHCIQVANTCHGWYDADPTKELWTWICVTRAMAGKSIVVDGVTYTFSSSYSEKDDLAQKAYIKYLCKNPEINWYDYDTVQKTNGQTAFSLSAYLSKFRTMTDAGERLYFDENGNGVHAAGASNIGYKSDGNGKFIATQYRIGSKISNTNNYDVCEPNFVALTLGANDANLFLPNLFTFQEAAQYIVKDMLVLGNIIRGHNPAIHVGLGFYHYYGVQNPDKWADKGIIKKFPATNWYQNLHQTINSELQNEVFDGQSSFSFNPIYYTQNVIGAPKYIAQNLNTLQEVIYDSGTDQLHANGDGWNGTAVGTLIWIFANL